MAKFLAQFLKALPFPDSVIPDVIDAYAPRYAASLALNGHLGSSSTLLADHLARRGDWKNLSALVYSANEEVLDQLLASQISEECIVTAIISTWRLSQTDQLRLLERPLSVDSASKIMADLSFSDHSRELARSFLPSYCDNYAIDTSVDTANERSSTKTRSTLKPPAPVFPDQLRFGQSRPLDLTLPISELGCLISGLQKLADPLTKSLGFGETSQSLRSWMLFLGLCEDDPVVPLQTVIISATHLARAEH